VHLPVGLTEDSFRIRLAGTPDGAATIRVIDYRYRAVLRTTYATMRVAVTDGEVRVPPHGPATINILAVVERHGREGGIASAILRGFGL